MHRGTKFGSTKQLVFRLQSSAAGRESRGDLRETFTRKARSLLQQRRSQAIRNTFVYPAAVYSLLIVVVLEALRKAGHCSGTFRTRLRSVGRVERPRITPNSLLLSISNAKRHPRALAAGLLHRFHVDGDKQAHIRECELMYRVAVFSFEVED